MLYALSLLDKGEHIMSKQYTKLQLKHQQQMRANREAEKLRKARTHRLIVRGAIVESLIPDADIMNDDEFQQIIYDALNRNETIETSRLQDTCGSNLRENALHNISDVVCKCAVCHVCDQIDSYKYIY